MQFKIKMTEQKQNLMREVRIEKVLLSSGAKPPELEKARKLLELISGAKAQVITSTKRIPDFNVRPGLEVGTRVTIRGSKALELLKRLLSAINNELDEEQIADNHFSFGIEEYIEIPEMKYQRDIGIRGLNVTVAFVRPGVRVKRKKIKRGKLPKKQRVTKEEIINYMEEHFDTDIE